MQIRRFIRMAGRAVVQAQSSVTQVVDTFYQDFATDESGRYWWWPQMVLLDPNELIVNDGYDKLYRVPFTISGDTVTFGDVSPVKIEYVDIAAAARPEAISAACTAIASVRGDKKVAARFVSRAESCPDRKEGENVKDLINKMRVRLGLPADTPDEEVIKLAETRLEATPEGEPQPGTEGEPEPEEGEGPQGDEHQPGPTPAQQEPPANASAVQVDAATLEQLREDARLGRAAHDKQVQDEEATILTAAVKCGKFPPSRKEHYAKLLKADREGTIALINELEENVIPVESRGVNAEGAEGQSGGESGYPVTWLPDVAARKARLAAQGGHERVTIAEG